MIEKAIEIDNLPQLDNPLFIAGFEGWGNALDISRGMADYLIQKLNARVFGTIKPDPFYRFDENRPVVDIKNGLLETIHPPGGSFYVSRRQDVGRDIIILKAIEPSLRWFDFVDSMLSLCRDAGVKTVVSLGSMYDNVLHTDSVISAFASSQELLETLKEKRVLSVNYKGPSAIHTTIHAEAQRRGFECASIWCHCPYYLQGTTHYGLLCELGLLLSSWGGFTLDTGELEVTWKDLSKQIQGLIDKNPDLQGMINDLRKTKIKGTWEGTKRHDKVIHLEDFLKPK